MANSKKIFISMGTPYTPDYAKYRDELEDFLRDQCQLDQRIIDKNEFPTGNPLTKIRDVMKSCNGLIAIAYERTHVADGAGKRGSSQQFEIKDKDYTTVWNHIEIAMAYSMNLPIYVLCQEGLVTDGLIENKDYWRIQFAKIVPGEMQSYAFGEGIRLWAKDKVMKSKSGEDYLKSLAGNKKISEYTPREIISTFTLLLGFFGGGYAFREFLSPQFLPFVHAVMKYLKIG